MNNLRNYSNNQKCIGNRYNIIETHAGGMGYVHYCLDTKENNFPVALKTFKPEFLSDRITRERFIREASIWVDLGFHPNIVQAYKVLHVAEDQSIFIIMQLIPTPSNFSDPTLRSQLLNSSHFPLEKSLRITLGIIQGMRHATSKISNLVHRDLKPENILLDTNGQPKITDFGLAHVRSYPIVGTELNQPSLNNNITQAGGLGTPLYMSPEQWLGTEVNERSDIYSLGCILYEMLTGHFAVEANSIIELRDGHLSGNAVKNVNQTNLDSTVKKLLIKCLDVNNQNRFGNWNEFGEILIRILNDKLNIQIPIDTIPIDISLLNQYQKAESYLAIGVAYINIGKIINSKRYFEEAQYIAEKQNFPNIRALAIANQGTTFLNQGYPEKAIEYFKQSINIFQSLGELNQICYHIGNIGNAYFELYDLEKAKSYYENAISLAEKLNDLQSKSRIIGNLGNIYLAKQDFKTALRLFQSAYDISKDLQDRSINCKHIASIASTLEGMGNYQKSLEYFKLSLNEAINIGDRSTEGFLYLSIGNLLYKQNKTKDGISNCKIALNIGREINDQYLTAKALGNLATGYLQLNQVKTATPLLKEAILIAKEINANDIYARASWSLGLSFELELKFNEAISYLLDAVNLFKSLNMIEYAQASEHLKRLRKDLGLL
jgi:serine/threonine protein kinase